MTSIARSEPTPLLPRVARATLVVIGVLPFLVPLLGRVSGALAHLVDLAFAPFCHRLPERTLVLLGAPMPVCSRCAGVYAGLALGALVRGPRASAATWRLALAIAALPMVVDVLTQDLGAHSVWHATRLTTGAIFGFVAAAAITSWLRDLFEPA